MENDVENCPPSEGNKPCSSPPAESACPNLVHYRMKSSGAESFTDNGTRSCCLSSPVQQNGETEITRPLQLPMLSRVHNATAEKGSPVGSEDSGMGGSPRLLGPEPSELGPENYFEENASNVHSQVLSSSAEGSTSCSTHSHLLSSSEQQNSNMLPTRPLQLPMLSQMHNATAEKGSPVGSEDSGMGGSPRLVSPEPPEPDPEKDLEDDASSYSKK